MELRELNDHETTAQGENAAICDDAPEHPAASMDACTDPCTDPASTKQEYQEPIFSYYDALRLTMFYNCLVESGQIPPLPGGELPACIRKRG
ncbi:MAG: hypothetical protein ACRD2L_07360 [Terriglobia bacterium]